MLCIKKIGGMQGMKEKITEWTEEKIRKTLPIRGEDSHKGTYGTGLLVAGSTDMPGAAIISSQAAMRSGIGKLMVGTSEDVIPSIIPVLPEATYWRNGLDHLVSDGIQQEFRAAAIGPGLPPEEKVEKALQKLLERDIPLIIDAGALEKIPSTFQDRKSPVILTPHPGEFSRITGVSIEKVQSERVELAKEWAEKLNAVIVLKGNKTVTAFPDGEAFFNPTGNAALAKGGTGDALTGMLLGMLCCHEDYRYGVLNGVYLHGACADRWVKENSAHTLLAHELSGLLPQVWHHFET
ncbi:NAD(P)H-hydrate dehydratase [Falsibacillus pallidus]|uniref:NAD(P)H-hydrate dehydratase n=1 Tax=Falsibacillus pallidus TaxID=493781 RepID=UPI003D95D73B